MKIRFRIFLGIILVVSIGVYFLLDWIVDDLTPRYRESTEEPLVDTARILASLAAATAKDNSVDVELFRQAFSDAYSQSFEARIYNFLKTDVDFRVYITSPDGEVVFDSRGKDEGVDYSQWRDVKLTLEGRYGARTSHDDIATGAMSGVMYVGAPILKGTEIIGVLTVGKPTGSANQFIEGAKREIMIGGLATCAAVIIVGLIISGMVTRPIKQLTAYAQAIRDGERVALPALGRSEMHELGVAFEEMRDALEGKQYVENYVQTLTHEVKSPLSAIQGAAELLKEEMSSESRGRFLENIGRETERIRSVVDKLLLLSSLESRKSIEEKEEIDLADVIAELQESMGPILEKKKLSFSVEGESSAVFVGEGFLVRQAAANLLQNAIDFSPEAADICVTIIDEGDRVGITVDDEGPGIPDFAHARVFERFYSLKRPDTGRKSSGLGLSLVKEVVLLHGGTIEIVNREETSGARAMLSFPK